MRVLLLADDCAPHSSSALASGYQTAKALSRHVEVTLATRVDHRAALQQYGLEGVDVAYIGDASTGHSPLWGLARHAQKVSPGVFAYGNAVEFERQAFRRFKAALTRGEFDVVHRLTPASLDLPSPLATWSPEPFVVGPLRGAPPVPSPLRAELDPRKEDRACADWAALRWLPYQRSTFRHAAAILVNSAPVAAVPNDALERVIDFPEIGIEPEHFSEPGPRDPGRSLVFLVDSTFGRCDLLEVVLRAFAESRGLGAYRLILRGEGPDRLRVSRLVADSGLTERVEFLGAVSHAEELAGLREADVFVSAGLRELRTRPLLEAMASGCVPIVVDFAGYAACVGEEAGLCLPLGSKDELVQRFRGAFEALMRDSAFRQRRARRAHERALAHFSWDARARKMVEVYEWVTGQRSLRPRFYPAPVVGERRPERVVEAPRRAAGA
jgi:glycosyltransferase involved in cell wall biosynthesis